MNGNMQIDDNMPEDLKNAINFLNEHNFTPEDYDPNLGDIQLEEVDGSFGTTGSSDLQTDESNENENENEVKPIANFSEASNVDLDDLESMF